MSNPLKLKIDPEKIQEIPMVDLAFMILKEVNTPHYYRDLMNEVAKLRGFTEEQMNEAIAQLYTEINIDGRFACVGTNMWGLKRWYPLERSDDPVANAKRPRIINDEDDDLEDDFTEEEDTYVADDSDEDYDSVDEEHEEDDIFDDDDDAEEVDEDVVIDEDDDLADEDSDEDEEESVDEEQEDEDL